MLPLLQTRELFNSERFSDITVKFGATEIKCHKLVLAQRSEYFEKLLDNKFVESTQRVIELKGDVPCAVEALIRHIYTGSMHAPGAEYSAGWRFYFDVMHTADKYLHAELSGEAFATFSDKVEALEDAEEIASVIALIRDDDQARDLSPIADGLERRHFHALVTVPEYFAALDPDRLQNLWKPISKKAGLWDDLSKHKAALESRPRTFMPGNELTLLYKHTCRMCSSSENSRSVWCRRRCCALSSFAVSPFWCHSRDELRFVKPSY